MDCESSLFGAPARHGESTAPSASGGCALICGTASGAGRAWKGSAAVIALPPPPPPPDPHPAPPPPGGGGLLLLPVRRGEGLKVMADTISTSRSPLLFPAAPATGAGAGTPFPGAGGCWPRGRPENMRPWFCTKAEEESTRCALPWLITDCLQSGHSWLTPSHWSMQGRWNTCKHGSIRHSSPSANSPRQIEQLGSSSSSSFAFVPYPTLFGLLLLLPLLLLLLLLGRAPLYLNVGNVARKREVIRRTSAWFCCACKTCCSRWLIWVRTRMMQKQQHRPTTSIATKATMSPISHSPWSEPHCCLFVKSHPARHTSRCGRTWSPIMHRSLDTHQPQALSSTQEPHPLC
mmetsp:Transcript_107389/g.160650  ORF Transcript_107389/g.160650 Transcript_107389/m.160650 type:complete len:347 (-) Transcript_107389:755-1795(-)